MEQDYRRAAGITNLCVMHNVILVKNGVKMRLQALLQKGLLLVFVALSE
jgi:hypothetical protein